MADTRHVEMRRTVFLIKTLVRDVRAGSLVIDFTKVPLLESYLEEHQKQLPFEGLPRETRFMMDRLGKLLGTDVAELYPVASHVRELIKIKINEPINRRQRFYTLGGFLLGIAGIAFGTFTFLFPPSTAPEAAVSESPATISIPKEIAELQTK